MKLPDFLKHEGLNAARRLMGLREDEFGSLNFVMPGFLTPDQERSFDSTDGLEISPQELEFLADGTLAYKNRRLLLYIRDVRQRPNGGYYEPRFHISNCETLQSMKEKGRFDRYVVNGGREREFKVNLIKRAGAAEALELPLSVCQHCLNVLNWQGFSEIPQGSERRAVVHGFSLDRFFDEYPRTLHPEEPKWNSDNAPLNDYTPDFSEVSKLARREANWTCQECRVVLSHPPSRRFLHVHHINGVMSDNRARNLRVLCIRCHAKQPHHDLLRRTSDYKKFVSSH